MAIKVIANYPNTKEGMRLYEERLAAAIAKNLRERLSKQELAELISRLEQLQKEKQAE